MKKIKLLPLLTIPTLSLLPIIAVTSCNKGMLKDRVVRLQTLNDTYQIEGIDTNIYSFTSHDTNIATVDDKGKISAAWSAGSTIVDIIKKADQKVQESIIVLVLDQYINFHDSSWDVFFTWLDMNKKGQAPMKTMGIKDGETLKPIYGLSDLIGQKRYVTVNKIKHEVIVIGTSEDSSRKYQIDQYDVGKEKQNVTLIFNFFNILCDENNEPIRYCWDEKDVNYNYWSETSIHHNLNDVDQNDDKTSVMEMIIESEPILAQNIKEIYKTVNIKNLEEKWVPITNKEKIFLPSFCNWSYDDTEFQTKEGLPYRWAATATTKEDRSALKRCIPGSEEGQPYWLSSPNTNSEWYVWKTTHEGKASNETISGGQLNIAPCFCI